MASATGPELRPADIGKRVRMIRKRRGLSLVVAAGLAGISTSYLSMLETGERRFDKHSLIDAVAEALGCSVLDLTNSEPYGPADRQSAEALTTIPGIQAALVDCTFDDVPDQPSRPLAELAKLVRAANLARDETKPEVAGQGMGDVLTELHILAATQAGQAQREALATLVEAAYVSSGVALWVGHPTLALAAAQRCYEAATRLDDTTLMSFATCIRVIMMQHLGARRRIGAILADAVEQLEPVVDPSAEDTLAAEVYGFLHLHSGVHAARLGRVRSGLRAPAGSDCGGRAHRGA